MNESVLRHAMNAVDHAINERANIRPRLPSPEITIDAVLVDRGAVHGDFTDDATLAQGLKDLMHNSRNWAAIDAVKREALEHVATKIARILSGDPNFHDHWKDLQGYPRLVEQRLP